MNVKEFEKRKKFNEASGIASYIDSNIKMVLNEYGLYEEVIEDKSKDIDKSIVEVLPQFNSTIDESKVSESLYGNQKNIKFDKRLGYYTKLYIGYVKEGNYRVDGSSGGMGTWILKELLITNKIDGVIHVKESVTKNKLFEYGISETVEEILEGSKTKYYPVELSEVLNVIKNKPGKYAIVGIPSFIMGVRLLAQHDKIIKERIKYTIGLVCGHQKSANYTYSMAWQLGFKSDEIIDFNYREKLQNRPASQYGIAVTGIKNGVKEKVIKPVNELYGQDWGMGFFKALASDYTDDVFNETADITLGDAWLKEYTDDHLGNNIVIVRNEEIRELIDNAIFNDKLFMDEVTPNKIFESQAAHYRHTHDELAYRLFKTKGWKPIKRVLPSNRISFFRRKIQDLRGKISHNSHVCFLEALEKNDFNHFIKKMDKDVKKYINIYRIQKIQKIGIKGIIVKIGKKIGF